jgi:hypothetical protein
VLAQSLAKMAQGLATLTIDGAYPKLIVALTKFLSESATRIDALLAVPDSKVDDVVRYYIALVNAL